MRVLSLFGSLGLSVHVFRDSLCYCSGFSSDVGFASLVTYSRELSRWWASDLVSVLKTIIPLLVL